MMDVDASFTIEKTHSEHRMFSDLDLHISSSSLQ